MIFAPSGGVLELFVEGLPGCEIRFVVDDGLTAPRTQPGGVAYTNRPVRPGRHRVAVQWRGAIEPPTRCVATFHFLTRTLADLERDAPDVAAVMKKNKPADFVLCDVLILSQPPGVAYQVYGIFTVDKKQLASGRAGAPVLKQDFLVHDRTAKPPEITYYTGFPAPGPHRSIEEFCARVGEPHYGCERVRGRWRCKDHHYRLEDVARMQVEPEIRAAIDAGIARAREEIARGAARPEA
jgi:hypothetical protein